MRQPRLLKLAASLLVAMLLWAAPAAALSTHSVTALINKQHALQPLNYEPDDLATPVVKLALQPDNPEMQLRAPAARALQRMFRAANQAGISLVLASGYRPYVEQAALYSFELRQNGVSAQEAVAVPGHSEHQTGLAADIITSDYVCAAQGCFAITRAAAWLQTNSYKYGFILRYPDYKQSITGYEYEPWHYRYVGMSIAGKLHNSAQTLEEYFDQR